MVAAGAALLLLEAIPNEASQAVLAAVDVPVIEVHISNPYRREPFRHVSYVSPAATGTICGVGAQGYALAVEALATLFAGKAASTVSKKGQE